MTFESNVHILKKQNKTKQVVLESLQADNARHLQEIPIVQCKKKPSLELLL